MICLVRALIFACAFLLTVPEAHTGDFTAPYGGESAGANTKKSQTKRQKKPRASAPVRAQSAGTAAPSAGAYASGALPGDGYRVGPRDIIDISVFDVPELSATVIVSDNGTIQLPLLGETPAAGKTPRELQADLTTRLGADYLQNPQVTVSVKEYNSRSVILTGEVRTPGIYPLKGKTSLLEVIAAAGGFAEGSDSTVLVLRKSGGKQQAAKFDVSAIETGRAKDPTMRAGDKVVAGSSMIKKSFGAFLKALPIAGAFAIF
jgi:polysaccharide export outer membrane protein